jgi:hypothetical protein
MESSTAKVILTVAVVGVVLYFVLKPAKSVAGKVPYSAGPQTSLKTQDVNAWAALTGVVAGVVNAFGRSSTAPAGSVPTSVSPPAAATTSWDNVSTGTLDQLAAGDAAQGVEGPF